MKRIKEILRINFIRNHFLRFGINGLGIFFKIIFSSKKQIIIIKPRGYLFPLSLRNESSDINSFYQTIFNEEYKVNLDFEPKIILDLGANIGLSSIFFLNKYPDAIVFAVEPDLSNFNLLFENTKSYNNIVRYNNGVWNRNAFLEIKDNSIGYWGYSVFEVPKKTNNSIDAISISQIVESNNIHQIDLLKVDIEGSEIEIFSDNFEEWLKITKVIIIELHDWMREGCAQQFFLTMSRYNFKLTLKGEHLICYLNH